MELASKADLLMGIAVALFPVTALVIGGWIVIDNARSPSTGRDS